MSRLELRMREVGIWDDELAKELGMTPRGIMGSRHRGIRYVKVAIKYAKVLKCKPTDILED